MHFAESTLASVFDKWQMDGWIKNAASLEIPFTPSLSLPGNSTVAAKLSAGSLVFNKIIGARI